MGLRLLVATGGTVSGARELPAGVRELVGAADEVLVVTPMLPGRLEWLASATDAARERADKRLHAVLGQLEELGVEGRGGVGSDDPLEAFADAIRDFRPDHLLIALRAKERAGWQERGLLDQLQERFSVPMTVFSVSED